jgi:hypothetical protein
MKQGGFFCMSVGLKRKNLWLDEKKLKRAKTILKAKTETEAINKALDIVCFRENLIKSINTVAGKGRIIKFFE